MSLINCALIAAQAEQAVRDMQANGLTEVAPNPYPPYSAAGAIWTMRVERLRNHGGAPGNYKPPQWSVREGADQHLQFRSKGWSNES